MRKFKNFISESIDFSSFRYRLGEFNVNTEEYDILSELEDEDWTNFLDEMAYKGITVEYDLTDDVFRFTNHQGSGVFRGTPKKFKSEFEVGDIVVCVDRKTASYLTVGKEYEVLQGNKFHRPKDYGIFIVNDCGDKLWYHDSHFKLSKPEETNFEEWMEEGIDWEKEEFLRPSKFKVGDMVKFVKKYYSESDDLIDDKDEIWEYINRIGEVIDIDIDINEGVEINQVEFDDGFTYWFYNNEIQLYKDEPEESNMEEWIEEEYDFERNEYERGDILNYETFGDGLVLSWDRWKRVLNIKFKNKHGKKLIHFDVAKNRMELVKPVDDTEDSNMEEWIEEKMITKFKLFESFLKLEDSYPYEYKGCKDYYDADDDSYYNSVYRYDFQTPDGIKYRLGLFYYHDRTLSMEWAEVDQFELMQQKKISKFDRTREIEQVNINHLFNILNTIFKILFGFVVENKEFIDSVRIGSYSKSKYKVYKEIVSDMDDFIIIEDTQEQRKSGTMYAIEFKLK